jgi:hypothetical protein
MRPKLTYSNVMSTLCFVLLLGGGAAYAASHLGKNSVGTKQLKKNAVTTAKIKKNAVTTAKIKDSAVTTAKIQDSAVNGAKIAAGSVGFEDLAAGSLLVANATGGPLPANTPGSSPLPLSGTTSFTAPGEKLYLLLGSLQAHLGDVTNGDFCSAEVIVFDNGKQAFEIFANSDGTTTITPSQENEESVLLAAGGLQNLTATVTDSTPACRAGSQVDAVHISIVQFP